MNIMTLSTPVTQQDWQERGNALLAAEESTLRGVIFRYVRNDHLVDDLYQDIAMKVMRRIHTVREIKAIRGWLFQTARNACLDYLRKQKRQPHHCEAGLEDLRQQGSLGRNPIGDLISQERIDAVQSALAELPASQQEVLRLRLEQGCDHSTIAENLGISRQAVEVRLCRARAKLKERLSAIMEGDL